MEYTINLAIKDDMNYFYDFNEYLSDFILSLVAKMSFGYVM